jgi:hypothetical protein
MIYPLVLGVAGRLSLALLQRWHAVNRRADRYSQGSYSIRGRARVATPIIAARAQGCSRHSSLIVMT